MPPFTKKAFNVIDKEEVNSDINSAFSRAVKSYAYFFHISFLECCKHVQYRPPGLQINKSPFISFETGDITALWEETIQSTEIQLMDMLLVGIAEKMITFESEFWGHMETIESETKDHDDLLEWWVKMIKFLEKEERKTMETKRKKLKKLLKHDQDKLLNALARFDEHIDNFLFKTSIYDHGKSLFPDIENVVNIVSLGQSFLDETPSETNSQAKNNNENSYDIAEEWEGRLKGVYVSDNVLNLSRRKLSKGEVSILSKGLKFVPTPTFVDKAAIKQELETFGRKLRLAWHFRGEDRTFERSNPFKTKSKFNPRDKDAAIEIYLSRLEEEILNLNFKIKYHNITKEEREAIKSLKNDTSIIIKEADKGSGIVVWDRDDYLKEAQMQLDDHNIYEKVGGEVISPLIKVIKNCIGEIYKRGDIPKETLDYFLVNNPKIGRFYLLPKIHKRLENVPGRPVISNSSFYTENISSFLDFHLKPLAQKVKSFLKDTNDFLMKLTGLPPLSNNVMLCTVDVVGLYPNIPHSDGMEAMRKALEQRSDKSISTQSLLELSKCVLENNVFEHNGEIYRQKQGTAIGTKMAPSYAILFMAQLEELILNLSSNKPLVWWRYIDDVFLLWEHGEDSLREFLEFITLFIPL